MMAFALTMPSLFTHMLLPDQVFCNGKRTMVEGCFGYYNADIDILANG